MFFALPNEGHLHSMPPHKHGISIWVEVHGFVEALGQVLFERGIFDDRDPQSVVESQHAFFTAAPWNTFDLFNVPDFETGVLAKQPVN